MRGRFQKDFERLPLVGFSVCSGIEIIREKLHPSNTVAFKSWDSSKMPFWARNQVETGMCCKSIGYVFFYY